MTRLALTILLLATGASAAEQHRNVIDIEHDTKRGVTCYILNGVGISCVPDSQIEPEPADARRGQPSPTQAPAPARNDERYSM